MSKNEIPYKIYLEESEMPKSWYNLRADMKNKPAPLLHPGTHQPLKLEELTPIFCEELAKQELDDKTPYIEIPEEIRNFYKMYRPSPLVRAYCLEKQLGTPAKIYYKFEGNNTSGSHKLNSAIAQAYYAKKQGLKGVTTETGAGQWFRSGLSGLYGKGFLRAEAVPPGSYADIRSKGHPFSIRYNQCRTGNPEAVPRYNRKPGMRHFRGRRGCNNSGRLPLRAWKRSCSGTSAPVSNRT